MESFSFDFTPSNATKYPQYAPKQEVEVRNRQTSSTGTTSFSPLGTQSRSILKKQEPFAAKDHEILRTKHTDSQQSPTFDSQYTSEDSKILPGLAMTFQSRPLSKEAAEQKAKLIAARHAKGSNSPVPLASSTAKYSLQTGSQALGRNGNHMSDTQISRSEADVKELINQVKANIKGGYMSPKLSNETPITPTGESLFVQSDDASDKKSGPPHSEVNPEANQRPVEMSTMSSREPGEITGKSSDAISSTPLRRSVAKDKASGERTIVSKDAQDNFQPRISNKENSDSDWQESRKNSLDTLSSIDRVSDDTANLSSRRVAGREQGRYAHSDGREDTRRTSFVNERPISKNDKSRSSNLKDGDRSEAERPRERFIEQSTSTPRNDTQHRLSFDNREGASNVQQRQNPRETNLVTRRAYSSNSPEIVEWLTITRYYDVEYREKTLKIHRLMAELDAQKEELARQFREQTAPSFMGASNAIAPAQQISSMGPPTRSGNDIVDVVASKREEMMNNQTGSKAGDKTRRMSNDNEQIRSDSPLKRRYADRDEAKRLDPPPSKYARLEPEKRTFARDLDYRKNDTGYRYGAVDGAGGDERRDRFGDDDDRHARPERKDRENGFLSGPRSPVVGFNDRRPRTADTDNRNGRVADFDRKNYAEERLAPRDNQYERPSRFSRQEEPPTRKYEVEDRTKGLRIKSEYDDIKFPPSGPMDRGRFDQRKSFVYKKPPYGRQMDSAVLKLSQNGNRFFIIKCFDEANIQTALREEIWTTQTKNESELQRAYRESRNVILIFSVNASKAFQGYARMESEPGDAPNSPSWSKTPSRRATGSFRIRWVTIAVTRFHRVVHLKNGYNDNEVVIVARDGQEVERSCGQELCEFIDATADYQTKNDSSHRR
ncbi:MAG: hypothetical protein M1814_006819 [Vezdaea aestivalis]|nr:MAG: hypothetical protein M1814_006819 [Vezdaea aestivalis]